MLTVASAFNLAVILTAILKAMILELGAKFIPVALHLYLLFFTRYSVWQRFNVLFRYPRIDSIVSNHSRETYLPY